LQGIPEVRLLVKTIEEGTLNSTADHDSSLHFDSSNDYASLHDSLSQGLDTQYVNSALCLPPGRWSGSGTKRLFDVTAVTFMLPLVTPILLLVGLAVRLSSRGPVLFLQVRVGQDGRLFNIFKFRTMVHTTGENRPLITTLGNQRFTPIGRFLRKWKLDELPQLLNVLRGDMSLVGPRPKVPDHEQVLLCRPGITGAATLAFAREEVLLDEIPPHLLNDYVQQVVLPTKRQIDNAYMARATFISDFALIIKSVLRLWDRTTPALYPSNEIPSEQTTAARPRLKLTGGWCATPNNAAPADD
jgi:lipopolysaccharide/colanic/teichoic acid biosynthesis glycosyltransferase